MSHHRAGSTLLALLLALGVARGQVVYKINCGGPAIPDKGWAADNPSLRLRSGAAEVSSEARAANRNPVYHNFAMTASASAGASFVYTLPVAQSGMYSVSLGFAEHIATRTTPRAFTVKAENNTPVKVTLNSGFMVKVTVKLSVQVTDGKLNLLFTNGNGARAIVSAITVALASAPSTSTRSSSTTTTTSTFKPSTSSVPQSALVENWVSRASLPVDMDEVSTQIVGNKVYLIGGGSESLFMYDIDEDEWYTKASRPYVGNHHAMHAYNNQLFVIGGLYIGKSKVQIYNINLDTWSSGPAIPWTVEGSVASATIGSRAYICGGISSSQTVRNCGYLDMAGPKWVTTADMPYARNHASSGTDGRLFYIFGGRVGGNFVSNGYDEVQIYDPSTDTWQTSSPLNSPVQDLPIGRGGMGRAVFVPQSSEFFIMGGETDTGKGATDNDVYKRVDVFNTKTMKWRRGKNMMTARHGIDPIGIPTGDGRIASIFVAGGGVSAGYSLSDVVEELQLL